MEVAAPAPLVDVNGDAGVFADRADTRVTAVDVPGAGAAAGSQPYCGTPRSAAWRIANGKIDADRDRRLAAKLVICRGAFRQRATPRIRRVLFTHLSIDDAVALADRVGPTLSAVSFRTGKQPLQIRSWALSRFSLSDSILSCKACHSAERGSRVANFASRLASGSPWADKTAFGCSSEFAAGLSFDPSPSHAIGPSFRRGADAQPASSRHIEANVRACLIPMKTVLAGPRRFHGPEKAGRGFWRPMTALLKQNACPLLNVHLPFSARLQQVALCANCCHEYFYFINHSNCC